MQQYPSSSQSDVELRVQSRRQDNHQDDSTRELQLDQDGKSPSKIHAPTMIWFLFGFLGVTFIVAFALIGIALRNGNDNEDSGVQKEPSILLSMDPNPPENYFFGGGLHAGGGEWVGKRNMSVPRSDLAAVLSPYDGKVYVLGGFDSNGTIRSTVEVFDPVFEIYEDVDVPDMPLPRYRFAAAATGDNVYVIGGWNEDPLIPLNTVHVYNIPTKSWSDGPNITYNRGDMAASVIDGKIYVVGGFGDFYDLSVTGSLLEMYDPQQGSWKVHSSMPTQRGDVGSTAYGGCLFAVGGWNNNPAPGSAGYTAAVERFCPDDTPEWTKLPDMPFPRGDKAVNVFNGHLMVVGGETGGDVSSIATNRSVQRIPLHDVEALLLNAEEATGLSHMEGHTNGGGKHGTWIPAAPHPGPRFRFASVTHKGPQGEQLFTFGGHAEQTRTTGETWAFLDTRHPVGYVHYHV
eukprot:gb/GECG01005726.1/.p1 GENE.gb/GECG01005726.1/~~gb/GECG01005726.1/.p1  ORF type:complete len:459 (+),score=61.89 gb/GECG01005726.1/:1-1377(+)